MYFLKQAAIQRGDRVVINGAGGSIGTFAIQLAKYFGAEVTAVDRTEKLDLLRSLGADQVMDYTQADFTQSGQTYEVIFDVVGTSAFAGSVRALTPTGRYLVANPKLAQIIGGRRRVWGSRKQVISWTPRTASGSREDFQFLIELLEAGQLHAVIDRCYPLEQMAEAHRYVETGQKKGHVVITVAQNNAPSR